VGAGDVVRVQITKADTYDLIGSVKEILPRPGKRPAETAPNASPVRPLEKLHRIATGAPLRVLG
jgi:hypothetical protein